MIRPVAVLARCPFQREERQDKIGVGAVDALTCDGHGIFDRQHGLHAFGGGLAARLFPAEAVEQEREAAARAGPMSSRSRGRSRPARGWR